MSKFLFTEEENIYLFSTNLFDNYLFYNNNKNICNIETIFDSIIDKNNINKFINF